MKPSVVCGGAELDIAGAQALHARLLATLSAGRPVVFDMAQVERVDTAIIQMLCAFVRDAQTMGMPVHWQHISPALQSAARLLNVEACLRLPLASPWDDQGAVANLEKQ